MVDACAGNRSLFPLLIIIACLLFGFAFSFSPNPTPRTNDYCIRCGPCLLMAPEFENAAKELKGRVRFAKLDTDSEETMAARLNIMGLPTLLFLDKYVPPADSDEDAGGSSAPPGARAVLKGRIEGALRKQNIVDLCEHYFFGGPAPELT